MSTGVTARFARHLVIFTRSPRLGRVKRRLARDIGVVAATAFYRRTLAGVVRRLAGDGRWRCWLAVTPDGDAGAPGLWPTGCPRIGQGPGDLGARMGRSMRSLPPGPVVIVGADIPDIQPRHVAAAFRSLGRHDVVFGPAADGGYWLVGLSRRPRVPDIFHGVRWSSPDALADTLANLERGASVGLLEVLSDVDDGEAYERWRASGAGSAFRTGSRRRPAATD